MGLEAHCILSGLRCGDPGRDSVQAALAQPGMVLKRPHGQAGQYKAEPDAIPMPKLTARQKDTARKTEADRKRKDAAEKRAQLAADRAAEQKPRRSWLKSSARRPSCGNGGSPCRRNSISAA